MKVGSVVRYTKKYPDGMEIDWIGVVVSAPLAGGSILVQWSNGVKQWGNRHRLEVICK